MTATGPILCRVRGRVTWTGSDRVGHGVPSPSRRSSRLLTANSSSSRLTAASSARLNPPLRLLSYKATSGPPGGSNPRFGRNPDEYVGRPRIVGHEGPLSVSQRILREPSWTDFLLSAGHSVHTSFIGLGLMEGRFYRRPVWQPPQALAFCGVSSRTFQSKSRIKPHRMAFSFCLCCSIVYREVDSRCSDHRSLHGSETASKRLDSRLRLWRTGSATHCAKLK